MNALLNSYLDGLRVALETIDANALTKAVEALETVRKSGNRVIVIGNGGSAATASHFACDIGKNAIPGDENRFKAVALTDSAAAITAYGNDVSFDQIFAEQMKNILEPGDLVVAISASGTSPDIVEGIRFAKKRGARVIGLSGFDGGILKQEAELSINVPASSYEQIEDAHMTILHLFVIWFKAQAEKTATATAR